MLFVRRSAAIPMPLVQLNSKLDLLGLFVCFFVQHVNQSYALTTVKLEISQLRDMAS